MFGCYACFGGRRYFKSSTGRTRPSVRRASSRRRPAQSGAHERNRTADLLLTMQMLYRLSYVGLNDQDPDGQHRKGGPAAMERCRAGLKTWLSVLACEDALPRAAFLQRKPTGVECEHGNLGPPNAGVNVKILRPMILRLRDGRPAESAGVPSCRGVTLWIQALAARFIGSRNGAGDGTRTRDIQLGRLELYQLSYSRSSRYTTKHCVMFRSLSQRPGPRVGGDRMVEGGGFEPPKASPTDLQSVPFDRSGTPPHHRISRAGDRPRPGCRVRPAVPPGPDRPGRSSAPATSLDRGWPRGRWSWRRDSNPQPPHYK